MMLNSRRSAARNDKQIQWKNKHLLTSGFLGGKETILNFQQTYCTYINTYIIKLFISDSTAALVIIQAVPIMKFSKTLRWTCLLILFLKDLDFDNL